MTTYSYHVKGTAADNQTWTATGTVTTENAGGFQLVHDLALSEAFEKLTRGEAVYGRPGVGCSGPYTITSMRIEKEADIADVFRDDIHIKPYTNVNAYYGTSMGPLKTMNIYNAGGFAVARAVNDDTAALIAAALNALETPLKAGE